MGRVIKFRAWVKQDDYKRMIYLNQQNLRFDYEDGFVIAFTDNKDFFRFEDREVTEQITVMQFTGLIDKNGKEIFESDIIKDSEGIAVVHFMAPAFIAVDRERKVWWLGAGKTYPATDNKLTVTEVIGNIYENPKLLEDK